MHILNRREFTQASLAEAFMPETKAFRRYTVDSEGLKPNRLLLNRCFKMWSSCVISWDAKVLPCCFDKHADHVLGDLISEPFQKIWKGSAYQNFRKKLITSRQSIRMCQNCTEGLGKPIRS